ARQRVKWMWAPIEEGLRERLFAARGAKHELAAIETDVASGALTPEEGAERLLSSGGDQSAFGR
ncbi:MAG TPA: hypothetical protein VKS78_15725, partial [Roseiarcus sp.]|nr:hypothetical protein [Roseiarcus sp.]